MIGDASNSLLAASKEREAQEQHLSGIIIIICFVACSRSHTKLVSRASMHSQSQSQSELDEALLGAAEDGSITEIQSLLDRHADIHAHGAAGATPLHLASFFGHHQCVELLLDRHADIDALNGGNETPLHYASSNGRHQCIALLLDRHADIHARNEDDDAAIHFASSNGRHQCIELLLDRHADVDALSTMSFSPLHLASWESHHQCVELLLDRHADIHARNVFYDTPLHLASRKGHHPCIKLLIDHGADKYLTDVRHCVPSLSLLLALATSISCLHLTHKCLSLSLRVDLSNFSTIRSTARHQNKSPRRQRLLD